MMALACVAVLLSAQLTAWQRVVGVALLALMSLTYWSSAVRRVSRSGRATHEGYLVLAVAVTGILCSFDPSLALVLFIVYAQVWLFSRSPSVGVAFTVVLSAAAMGGFVVYYLRHRIPVGRLFHDVGLQMAVSLLFSVLLGLWISRIVRESRERAELIAELESARDELAAANHTRGVMAERERMAREIHDTLAQGFASIVMLAQAATAEARRNPAAAQRRLAAIEDVARENLSEARALVATFAPLDLGSTTLRDAVRRLAERFSRETGLSVDVDIPDLVSGLSRDQEVVLLRAAQEALTNVRRHADARHVRIRLLAGQGAAQVEIVDDGVGFSPAEPTGGFGLEGMRGRVAEVGGQLDVRSSPGAGTQVVVHVPTVAPAGEAGRDGQEGPG